MENPIVDNKTLGLKERSSASRRLWGTKKIGNRSFPSYPFSWRQQLPTSFPHKTTPDHTLQNKNKSSSKSKRLWRQFLAAKKRFAIELHISTLDFCNNWTQWPTLHRQLLAISTTKSLAQTVFWPSPNTFEVNQSFLPRPTLHFGDRNFPSTLCNPQANFGNIFNCNGLAMEDSAVIRGESRWFWQTPLFLFELFALCTFSTTPPLWETEMHCFHQTVITINAGTSAFSSS